MAHVDWRLYAWVMRGSRRRRLLAVLNKPRLPTELKKEARASLTNVSKVLRAMQDKDLVQCLTPENKTGKLYRLTEEGQRIREQMLRKEDRFPLTDRGGEGHYGRSEGFKSF